MEEGLELSGRRKDASEFPADIMLSRIETKRGNLTKIVIRNGTAHMEMAERIQQLNRSLEKHVGELQTANQELETFSYSVSHDLRAPLRQIDGFARILGERMGPQSDSDSSHYLKRIQAAATHMGHLLEGLLDLGRLGRQGLRVQPTDFNSLVSEVIEELKLEMPNRQIEWILDPLPMINCDRILVKAVFCNLLSNAVKFTRLRECAIIRVGQRLENGETVIFVGDNGVGFNMKYADKLFGVFQRLHRYEDFPGTGIGLATVQRIIKKHGGRIWAEAELNSYATFHFTLLPGGMEQAEGSNHESEVLHE
jgi:light-regulated signal transduction histidine kinase (bacteriophytochrome)